MMVWTRYMDNIVITPLIPGAFISHSWHVTPWSDCSRSCGRGEQTRKVICRMKITASDYGNSANCSADSKPDISEQVRYCNSIACDSDWDTKKGFTVSNSLANNVHLPGPVRFNFLCNFLWVTASIPLYSLTPFSLCLRRQQMVYSKLHL